MSAKSKFTLYPNKGKLSESEWNFMNRYGELHFGEDVSEIQRKGHALYTSLARNGKPEAEQEKAVADEMTRMKAEIQAKKDKAYQKWFAPKKKPIGSDSSSSSSSSSSKVSRSSRLNDEVVFEKFKLAKQRAAVKSATGTDDQSNQDKPKRLPVQDSCREEITKLKVCAVFPLVLVVLITCVCEAANAKTSKVPHAQFQP